MNDSVVDDDGTRPAELEQARALLRAIEPPVGTKERVEQALLLQGRRERARTGWRWGLGLAFLAATSAAAVGDYIPVRRVFQLIQGSTPATVESTAVAPQHQHSSAGRVATQLPVAPSPTQPTLTEEPTGTDAVVGKPPPATAPAATHRPASHLSSTETASQAPAPLPPSELAQLVAEFKAAKVLAQDNPERGLIAFRKLQKRWPNSPLRPEIDLQIVSLLNRMGKHDESKHEAEVFVQDHPENPRAKELAKELESAQSGSSSK